MTTAYIETDIQVDTKRLRLLMENIIDTYISEMARTKSQPPMLLLSCFNAIGDSILNGDEAWQPENGLMMALTLAIIFDNTEDSARCVGIADALSLHLSDEQVHAVQKTIDEWNTGRQGFQPTITFLTKQSTATTEINK